MLDLFRRLEKEPDSYRGTGDTYSRHLPHSWMRIFLMTDYHDEDDEEEYEGSEGDEESGDDQGSHNSDDDENVTVGLTPQQQELLQIVSPIIAAVLVPEKEKPLAFHAALVMWHTSFLFLFPAYF